MSDERAIDGRDYVVLRLITRLNIGGPSRHALLLSRRLEEEFPALLVAGEPPTLEGLMTDPAVPVKSVPLTRPIRPIYDLRALLAVRRLLAVTGVPLLHTHMAKAGAIGRLAALSRRRRPLLVHTFHGHVLEGYFSKPQQWAFIQVERWLARRTDVLIAVSPEIRDSLLQLRIGSLSQYRVVPVGIDLEPFLNVKESTGQLRSRLNLPPHVPLVGIIGRLVPIKNHGLLFKAIVALPGVHLAVIGDGELRLKLEEQTRLLGIEERVHFIGWVDDMAAIMSDLDVVALTSYNEGTPVSLIEASASGRAVVATNVGGVSFVVQDGLTGLLAKSEDSEIVTLYLGRLLDNRSLRIAMGTAARSHVSAHFGADRLVGEIRSLYRDMLNL